MSERFCHYCEQPKCKCRYRAGRKGEFSLECQNHSRQTTIGELKKFVSAITLDDSTPAVWLMSYTTIDPNKPTRTKAKSNEPSVR
jgi:hypothetical protein